MIEWADKEGMLYGNLLSPFSVSVDVERWLIEDRARGPS